MSVLLESLKLGSCWRWDKEPESVVRRLLGFTKEGLLCRCELIAGEVPSRSVGDTFLVVPDAQVVLIPDSTVKKTQTIGLPEGWSREKPTESGVYTIIVPGTKSKNHVLVRCGAYGLTAVDSLANEFPMAETDPKWVWYRHPDPTTLSEELLRRIAEEMT